MLQNQIESRIAESSNSSIAAAAEEIFDPAFGIRISKPLITLNTVNTFCSGMRKIRLSNLNTVPRQLSNERGGRNAEEWVTMGVLVEKSECKKSANGNAFMVWRIADLTELQGTVVKVLLFGDCFRQYWKLQIGNTILLNNPQFGEQQAKKEDGRNNEVVLKLTKAGQLIEIGFCPDLGRCQGRKANDGEQCTNFVNKSRSLYCAFHLQQKARNVAANRGTLNRSTNLPTKNWQRKEFGGGGGGWEEKQPIGIVTINRRRHTLESGGKIFTKPTTSMIQRGTRQSIDLEKQQNEKIDKILTENPHNFGSKNLRILKLHKENHDPKLEAEKPSPSIVKQHLMNSMREFINSQPSKLTAANIVLKPQNDTTNRNNNNAEMKEQMKKIKRAAEILKNSQNKENEAKRQKLEDNSTETEKQSSTAASSSRGPLLGASFTMEQIRALLAKKGAHEEEAAKEELNRQNKYFDQRELTEQLETNATTLMEIKNCKVVSCKQCDYTSIHQSAYCKLQRHSVCWHQADKRFFKCQDCQRRTTSYEMLPKKPCMGCKSTRFVRVAMRDERKVILEEEKLKIREEEQNFSTTAEQ